MDTDSLSADALFDEGFIMLVVHSRCSWFFTYRYIFSESFCLYPMVNSQKGSIFAVQKIKGTIFPPSE